MDYSEMEQYWIWLSSIEGIGPRKFYQLISEFENAKGVWEHSGERDLRYLGHRALVNLRKARDERYLYTIFARLQSSEIHAVTRISEGYPQALTHTEDAPPTIYVKGEADLDAEKTFGIVGSRRCTRDGRRAAKDIAKGLASEGVTVISGLALGVDTAAHEGAIMAHGTTIAVLGSGLNMIYPQENANLANEIIENGGALVSEYLPNMPPLSTNFPARNRIISGMSKGILLVEGERRSGAMITVNFALEQGREVFALPGNIYSSQSASPNQLLLDGAPPAVSYWDIVEYMKWGSRPAKQPIKTRMPELNKDEAALALPLRDQSLTLTELQSITGFTSQKINSLLTTLELRGIISKQPGGEYRAF